MDLIPKISGFIVTTCLSAQMLWGGLNTTVSTATMKVYDEGAQQLIVYPDVPGAELHTNTLKSPYYTIRVRSAASDYPGAPNDGWVDCFPHYTYNRALELPDIPANDGGDRVTTTQNYLNHTAGWSQTYANIEMTPNTTVEVEIGRVGNTPFNGSAIVLKSAVHPAQKVLAQRTEGGKAYFTINNPGQFVIDVNGQMDDHNAVINPMPGNPPVHSVTLFANPILAKPAMSGPGILSIAPSAAFPTQSGLNTDPGSSITTIVFQPGVHRIGKHYNLFPGKRYCIPGDAIILGTLSNNTSPLNGFRSQGDSITIDGYGTLNGIDFPHEDYAYAYPEIPDGGLLGHRGIVVENAVNFLLYGIAIVDTPNFATNIDPWPPANDMVVNQTVRWSKVITWKANGDGYGGVDLIEDSFLRTNDDANYVKGSRRRLTTWKDGAAQMFRVPQLPVAGTRFPYVVEDCDVIYNRTRDNSVNGNVSHVFDFDGAAGTGVIATDLTIRNIRLHDRRGNARVFNFKGEPSYTGITVENISAKKHTGNRKSILQGTVGSPWNGWPKFKNVTFDDGTNIVPLTVANFGTYFDTNEFVTNLQIEALQNFTLDTTNTDANQGAVTRNPNQATYPELSSVTLTAVANPGFWFTGWSGDATGTSNPLTVVMTNHKTITANFAPVDINVPLVITTPGSYMWTVPPGVSSIKVQAWGGGGAGGSAKSTGGTGTARSGGGAGGNYSQASVDVAPGQAYQVIVGSGGVSPTDVTVSDSVDPAQQGGASVFLQSGASSELVKANGGAGGKNAFKSSGGNTNLSGGIGTTSGNIGDVLHAGGTGGTAVTTGDPNGGGGGGGGAGDTEPGDAATNAQRGTGGMAGGGNGSNGRGASSANNPALPGQASSGGGGGVTAATGVTNIGGAGGDGKVIITYVPMTFTLNAQAVNGSITLDPPGGTYSAGTEVTLTAVPAAGYRFNGWSGDLTGSEISPIVLMDADKSISADFELIIPTLSSHLDGSNFTMSWPLTSPGWTLEWSTSLAPESWTEVPPPYPTNATEFFWQETLPHDKCFYRLRKP